MNYIEKKNRLTLIFLCLMITYVVSAQTIDQEIKMGNEYAQQIKEQMGVIEDHPLSDYVEQVGARLGERVVNSPYEFQFTLLDEPVPNAFALPGGHVFVTRGLLMLVNDESELAGVIGHEIIHITERHSIKQMRKSILPGLLMLPGAIVGAFNPKVGEMINTPIAFGGQAYLSSYSRKHERQSDENGILIASLAGYDPYRLASFLERMSEYLEKDIGHKEEKNIFDTHPYTPDRVVSINKEANNLDWTECIPIIQNKNELIQMQKDLLVGDNPAQGIFDDSLFLHADMDFRMVFPLGWDYINLSSAVGAINKNQTALISLSLADPEKDPEAHGQEFIDKMLQQNYTSKLNEAMLLNRLTAYHVQFEEAANEEAYFLDIYWIKKEAFVFKLETLGFESTADSIFTSVASFRKMEPDDIDNIKETRIDWVEAIEGEQLETLCQRTNNVWSAEITALVNDISLNDPLSGGLRIKIAREYPYLAKE